MIVVISWYADGSDGYEGPEIVFFPQGQDKDWVSHLIEVAESKQIAVFRVKGVDRQAEQLYPPVGE